MPAGMQVGDYDIICLQPGESSGGAVLRRVEVPISTTVRPLRGVAVRRVPHGPNPLTGRGDLIINGATGAVERIVGVNNVNHFMSDALGQVMRVWTLTILGIESMDGKPSPPEVIFDLYRGTAGSLSRVDTFVVAPNSWEYNEMLVQVSGVNATQFEFHARTDPTAVGVSRCALRLAINVALCDDAQDRVWLGPNVRIGGP